METASVAMPRTSSGAIPAVYVLDDKDDPTESICEFISRLTFDDLPADVVHFAKRHILDVLGVTIGGSAERGVAELVRLVQLQGGAEESSILCHRGKVPAAAAAFAMGPMSRALDMGDVHLGWGPVDAVAHTAEYVFPAMLGALGRVPNVNGRDFILSFTVGTELMVRIGGATQNTSSTATHGAYFNQGGWHIFGPVAAVAKLLGLDRQQLRNALGIAKCVSQTHDMKMYSPATLMVRMHHAFVAQTAVNCCLLAQAGIDGPQEIFAGKLGFLFLTTRGQWPVHPELLSEDWNKEWYFRYTSFKPFTSCKATHTAATALTHLVQDNSLDPSRIRSISVETTAATVQICCSPADSKWNPVSVPGAQFSLPYVLAAVANFGEFGIEQLRMVEERPPEVWELMKKISVHVNPDLGTHDAKVIVTTVDGKRFERLCRHAKGSPELPFSDDDHLRKFLDMCKISICRFGEETLRMIADRILSLDTVANVQSEVVERLVPTS